jgi:hypothetical protein
MPKAVDRPETVALAVIGQAFAILASRIIGEAEALRFRYNTSSVLCHVNGRKATEDEILRCQRFCCCEDLGLHDPHDLTLIDCIEWLMEGIAELSDAPVTLDYVMTFVGVGLAGEELEPVVSGD